MAADPDPAVPPLVAEELEECSDEELRAVIDYAQSLLYERIPSTEEIEARPGEKIVRTEERDAYTLVVVTRDDAEGRFVYHVTPGTQPGDEEEQFHWRYLGRVME